MMDLDQALGEVEREFDDTVVGNSKAFDVIVKNETSGQKTNLYVTKANTLGQVLNATATKLGVDLTKNDTIFVNETTGVSATDLGLTLGEFKAEENTVISIISNGKVAAN